MPPTDEDEQAIEVIRAGLWALFAAASASRPWAGPSAPDTADIITRSGREADGLLAALAERFDLDAMLAP